MAKLRRWRWALLVAMLLLAGLAFAFWPASVPVDTGQVTRGEMAVGVTDRAVTQAREFYVVSAPVTGYLERIPFKPGDIVARGAVITRMSGRPATPLDPRSQQELQGALGSAQAAVRSARAALAQSRADLARAEELAARGFLARAQLEAAQTRVATGEASLAQAQAETARVRAMLALPQGEADNPVPVRAPASGAVLTVITESEGVVAQGTPLVTIGDAGEIELVVDLLSREAVRVSPGDRVEISRWGGPQPLAGTVHRVEPYGRLKISALGIEEQRVHVIVRFAPQSQAQAARLGHGYEVDATIVLWRSDTALRVPIGALFRGADGGWRVFAVEGGRARERGVQIGRINDEFGEVTGGLDEGAQVVLNPPNALEDGARIARR